MAWTDQCKIAFKSNADHQIWTQKGKKNLTAILKKLTEESGIPYNTLKRWYYEKEKEKIDSIKNDTTQEPAENKEENKNSPETPEIERPLCFKCGKALVEIDKGKIRSKNSRFYGLCTECRRKAKVINDAIALATEENNGEWTICPKCNHHFLIPKKGEAG